MHFKYRFQLVIKRVTVHSFDCRGQWSFFVAVVLLLHFSGDVIRSACANTDSQEYKVKRTRLYNCAFSENPFTPRINYTLRFMYWNPFCSSVDAVPIISVTKAARICMWWMWRYKMALFGNTSYTGLVGWLSKKWQSLDSPFRPYILWL